MFPGSKMTGRTTTRKDKGYSWVILSACFFMYFLTMGTIKSFGILYAELLGHYKGGSGNTASIGSTCSFIQSFLGPLANALSLKFSFRRVAFSGGVLLSIGFLTSAFTERMGVLYITYSLITGVGYALTFLPCTTILNFYFEKNRALANGIVLSGSGLGGFAFPFLYRYLFDYYGLHGTMIVLSGVMLNCCVAASFFRQPLELVDTTESSLNTSVEDSVDDCVTDKINDSKEQKEYKVIEKTCDKGTCKSVRGLLISVFRFRWSLLRSFSFFSITVAFALAIVGYGANFYILPVLIESEGYGKDNVAVIMCIIGILEVISRISFGWFVDRRVISTDLIFVFSMAISSICSFSVPHLPNIYLLYCYAGLVGTFPGSLYTLLPVVVIDLLGLKALPGALGIMTLFNSLVAVIGIPCLGWLEDLTGSWDASFYYMGAIFFVSAVIVLIIHLLRKRDIEDSDTSKEEDINLDNSQESKAMLES